VNGYEILDYDIGADYDYVVIVVTVGDSAGRLTDVRVHVAFDGEVSVVGDVAPSIASMVLDQRDRLSGWAMDYMEECDV